MLRQIFVNPITRQVTLRRFSTQDAWIDTFKKVVDRDTQLGEKIPHLKNLLSNELSYTKYFPSVQSLLDELLQSQFVNLPALHADIQLIEKLQKFKLKCLENESGRTLSTAIYLNNLIKDPKLQKKGSEQIIGKFESFIKSNQLSLLSQNIDLLATFIDYSEDQNRTDVVNKIFTLVNDLYSHYSDSFSFESQLRLMDIFQAEYKDPQHEKVTEIAKNISENLREASFPELMYITFHLTNRHRFQLPVVKDKIEKSAIAMLSYTNKPNELVYLFSTVALFCSEHFWEKVTPMMSNIFELLDPTARCEVIYLFAICRRGSDELWEKFYKTIARDIESLDKSSKMKVYFSNQHIAYETNVIDFGKLEEEIFSAEFMQQLSFPDLLIMIENVLAFENIPADKRKRVIDLARKLSSSGNPQVKGMIESLFHNYKAESQL